MVLAGTQMQNLSTDFAASTAANITWQLFGNGVIVGPRRTPGQHHSPMLPSSTLLHDKHCVAAVQNRRQLLACTCFFKYLAVTLALLWLASPWTADGRQMLASTRPM